MREWSKRAAKIMSGWGNLSSFAKSALTTAQKRIDKVLDIHDEDGEATTSSHYLAVTDPDADVSLGGMFFRQQVKNSKILF